jgi:hypothetical protein
MLFTENENILEGIKSMKDLPIDSWINTINPWSEYRPERKKMRNPKHRKGIIRTLRKCIFGDIL